MVDALETSHEKNNIFKKRTFNFSGMIMGRIIYLRGKLYKFLF